MDHVSRAGHERAELVGEGLRLLRAIALGGVNIEVDRASMVRMLGEHILQPRENVHHARIVGLAVARPPRKAQGVHLRLGGPGGDVGIVGIRRLHFDHGVGESVVEVLTVLGELRAIAQRQGVDQCALQAQLAQDGSISCAAR